MEASGEECLLSSDSTPTKTVSRIHLSPKSKQAICILCLQNILKADNRRKLFSTDGTKTKPCFDLETLLGVDLEQTSTASTNVVCRNCADKNANLVKKIVETREKFAKAKSALLQQKGSTSVKRMCRPESVLHLIDDGANPKRRSPTSLFQNKESTANSVKDVKVKTQRENSTQTTPWPVQSGLASAVYVVLHFANSYPKTVKLPSKYHRIGRHLAFGTSKTIAAAVMSEPETKDATYDVTCADLTTEISGLCSRSDPSVLRKTSKEDLMSFSWQILYDELKQRAPRFLQVLNACIRNPSQTRNVHKQGNALIPPLCDAGSKLISIFNDDMNAFRRIKSIILRKGGLKKVAYIRLSPLYVCMGYQSTNKMFEMLGSDFDMPLKIWKAEVELGVKREKELMYAIEHLENDNASLKTIQDAQKELHTHRSAMHPGYSFTGDNVDMRVLPRQMTLKNRNKAHHMFQMVAFKNRVNCNHLRADKPNREISSEPFTTFLPSADEQRQLVDDLTILLGLKWAELIPELAWYRDYLPDRIFHEKMEETKKKTEMVHLGVLRKNEQYEEDMIDILEYLHPYVPGHSDETDSSPVKTLSGGDYLTFERHKEAQSSMQDARTPSARLEGFIPKIEDFHAQAEWLEVIWFHLYNRTSARDKGTLHAAKNAIDARNVSDDPHNKFYASGEFVDKVLDAYLIVGAMYHHGMESVDGEPTQKLYQGLPNDAAGKQLHVTETIKSFIEEHVVNQVPELSTLAPLSNNLTCRFCGKRYKQATALRNHEQRKHDFNPANQELNAATEEDRVYNYTHQVLILLLLRLDHNDAIRLGDGDRVLRLYKFFCFYFKVSKCPKYAIAMLQLQAQVNCLLSPRLAHSLTLNRFVNNKGKLDSNHPMDLSVEHDNKDFKNDIHSYRGEIIDKSIARVGQSVEPTNAILSAYDKATCVKKPSGRHTMSSTEEDIMVLVEHVLDGDVYRKVPGRKHDAFPNMSHNLLDGLDPHKLKTWISNSLKKFSKKHFYEL